MRLAVLGFGLIGGSIAAAASSRAGAKILAIDRAAVLDHPRARALAETRIPIEDPTWPSALPSADLVVLATPVQVIESLLDTVLASGPPVTDCGSTKRRVALRARATAHPDRFVPGHPMAGAPEGGLDHARPDLFDGRRWILCPETASAAHVQTVSDLATRLGADVVLMTAIEHDRVVALTSHVPQILSSVLAVLGERRQALAGVGPAYLSATRRAGGAERMWRDIFATNHDEVAAALWDVTQELEVIAAGLHADTPDLGPVLRLLERARARRSD